MSTMSHKYMTNSRPKNPEVLEKLEKQWTVKIPAGIEHEFKEYILPTKRGKK